MLSYSCFSSNIDIIIIQKSTYKRDTFFQSVLFIGTILYENILTSSFLIILLEDIIYNIVSLYITIQIYISSNYFVMKKHK